MSQSMAEEKSVMNEAEPEDQLNRSMSIEGINNLSNRDGTVAKQFIKNLHIFFGKLKSFITSNSSEDIEISPEAFGPLGVSPKDGNLYDGLENVLSSKLENYKDQEGKVIEDVTKENWVEEQPGVLCIQIQRAQFNKETKRLEKNNEKFTFNDQIFIDRFLYKNRKTVQSIRQTVDNLKAQIKKLKLNLTSIESFNDNKTDLVESLGSSISFLTMLGSQDRIENFPNQLGDSLKGNYRQEISTLQKLQSSLRSEKVRLQNEIKTLEQRVKTSYSEIEKSRYNIFSIIMHSGTAESGHYYTFIKDGLIWYKYNDFNVSKVEESEVYTMAYGGGGNESAYCIFYQKESLTHTIGGPLPMPHKLLSESDRPKDYRSLVPIPLRVKLEGENKVYQDNLLLDHVKQIINKYSKKAEILRDNSTNTKAIVNKHISEKKFNPSLKSITNFGSCKYIKTFLCPPKYLSLIQLDLLNSNKVNPEYKEIFKWLVLNDVVKRYTQENFKKVYSLENIYENGYLYNTLLNKLSSLNVKSLIF